MVTWLLDHGAEAEAMNSGYRRPLHEAASFGRLEATCALLEVLQETPPSLTTLPEVSSSVWQAKADVRAAKPGNGLTALHLACDKGHAEVCSALCDHRADVLCEDREGYCPIHWASREGHLDAARVLLERKGNFCYSRPFELPLANLCGVALSRSGDPNRRSELGRTALHSAAMGGNPAIIEILLDAKVEVGVGDKGGLTPLHDAAYHGHVDVATVLLRRGADIETEDSTGQRALAVACREHPAVVALLLDSKAEVNVGDNKGYGPLHYAVGVASEEIVRLLLDAGADRHAPALNGDTPSAAAAKKGFQLGAAG